LACGVLGALNITVMSLLAALEAEKQRRLTENRLAYYKPYPKQAEFHEAGATKRERLLMAANHAVSEMTGFDVRDVGAGTGHQPSALNRIRRAVRNSKAKRSIGFGSMRNRRPTSIRKR
jgi:phage terminase large subunit-like protein